MAACRDHILREVTGNWSNRGYCDRQTVTLTLPQDAIQVFVYAKTTQGNHIMKLDPWGNNTHDYREWSEHYKPLPDTQQKIRLFLESQSPKQKQLDHLRHPPVGLPSLPPPQGNFSLDTRPFYKKKNQKKRPKFQRKAHWKKNLLSEIDDLSDISDLEPNSPPPSPTVSPRQEESDTDSGPPDLVTDDDLPLPMGLGCKQKPQTEGSPPRPQTPYQGAASSAPECDQQADNNQVPLDAPGSLPSQFDDKPPETLPSRETLKDASFWPRRAFFKSLADYQQRPPAPMYSDFSMMEKAPTLVSEESTRKMYTRQRPTKLYLAVENPAPHIVDTKDTARSPTPEASIIQVPETPLRLLTKEDLWLSPNPSEKRTLRQRRKFVKKVALMHTGPPRKGTRELTPVPVPYIKQESESD